MAQPHLAFAMPQMLTIAHGHQDQSRRRARAQNVSIPFGSRERGSIPGRRYPRRARRIVHARGRLRGRGPSRCLFVSVVVVMYGRALAPKWNREKHCAAHSDHGRSNGVHVTCLIVAYSLGSDGRQIHLVEGGSRNWKWHRACSGQTNFACRAFCLATTFPSPRTGGGASRIVIMSCRCAGPSPLLPLDHGRRVGVRRSQ